MKNSKLVFNFLVASLVLTSVCNLNARVQPANAQPANAQPANAQPANDWVEQALGSYQSQIWSAASLIPGTTEFRAASDGSLEGSYTMNERGKIVPGTLSQCQAIQLRVMRCIWNDRYGAGNLEVTFSEDFSSFNGYWGSESSELLFGWSGSR